MQAKKGVNPFTILYSSMCCPRMSSPLEPAAFKHSEGGKTVAAIEKTGRAVNAGVCGHQATRTTQTRSGLVARATGKQ